MQAGRASEETGRTGGRGTASPGRPGVPETLDPLRGQRPTRPGAGSQGSQAPRPTLPRLSFPKGARDRSSTLARNLQKEDEEAKSPAGPLTSQAPNSGGARHTRCGQSPAGGRPGAPGPARKGPAVQRALGRAAAPASPAARGAWGTRPCPWAGRCRTPRSSGAVSGALHGPAPAAPAAPAPARPPRRQQQRREPRGGRRGRGRRCRHRRAGSGRPAPTSARSPAAPGVERGVGASRERGGRCFPRHSPAGGARPLLVPVRPLRDAGTHRAGVGERAAPCAPPRSEGAAGLLRCGHGAAAEAARGDGRPGEVPRQRR